MQTDLFRKVAVDRLSSPEQLDRVIRITGPRGWLIVAGLAVLTAAFFIWTVIGTVSEELACQGMMLSGIGTVTVTSDRTGQVLDVSVQSGSEVKKGAVIARLLEPDLADRIAAARAAAVDGKTASGQFVLKDQLAQIEQSGRIACPFDGKILEVLIRKGNWVTAGDPIVHLEISGQYGNQMRVLAFVPAAQGKKIIPGSAVKVAPSTVKKEAEGMITGKVVTISSYPVSRAEMRSVLGNDDLVDMFTKEGPLFQVEIALESDAGTYSGFHWTTGKGPETVIGNGTMCDVLITIKEERPIDIMMEKHIGSEGE